MLNQVVFAGRLISKTPIREEMGKKFAMLTIAVPRSYKNANGEYETDFIKIKTYNMIAENTLEYIRQGDLLGVKGRVENYLNDTDRMEIVGEKITFLSSNRN